MRGEEEKRFGSGESRKGEDERDRKIKGEKITGMRRME